MEVVYFLEASAVHLTDDRIRSLKQALHSLPGALRGEVFTPQPSLDPFLDDGPGPALAMQVRFADPRGLAEALVSPAFASLRRQLEALPGAGQALLQEALALENTPLTESAAQPGRVAYQVNYHRPAADEAAFLAHYRSRHPPILLRLPGLRGLQLGLPIDWSPVAGIATADRLLFCEVSFDSLAALNAALASQIRRELRRDFATFPPFSGPVTHYAMRRC